MDEIIKNYKNLQKIFKDNENGNDVTELLFDLFVSCMHFLGGTDKEDLRSLVNNKRYFAFKNERKLSRAINESLFCFDQSIPRSFLQGTLNNDYSHMNADDITKACYTIAISFCSIIDLLKDNDQKTPGTFFEYFIGHLFSRKFGVKPRMQLDILNLDMRSKLPTDFIIDMGENKPKYHIPVKTSTRERVIQVWGHQRLLDGVYGTGRFLGLLTCLSESKLDHKKHEVVEICLPDQWRLYQMFISQLKRIYYLDLPERYAELNNVFPKMYIKQFGEFFFESENLEQ